MSKTTGKKEAEDGKKGDVKKKTTAKKKEVIVEKTARVRYATGMTLNMGDFNSVRVDIDVTRECEDNDGAISETLLLLQTFVDSEMKAKVNQHRGVPDVTKGTSVIKEEDTPPFDCDDVKDDASEEEKDLWD